MERAHVRACWGVVFLVFHIMGFAAQADDRKPNVLFLVVDALRADAASEAGPFLKDFRKESVSFSNCFAAATSTKMSITSLWTSLYVTEHEVVHELDHARDELTTLAEILGQNGYETGLFSGSPWLASEFNLEQGFKQVELIAYLNEEKNTVDGRDVNRHFFNWLQSVRSKPFFAHIHYMDCHASSIDYQKYYPPVQLQTYCINGPIPQGFDSTVVENMKKEYRSAVGTAQSRIEEVFAQLKSSGLWNNTIIVITGDHGEEFGEHGGLGHGTSLHDELLRVPLIIHHPGWSPGLYDFPVSLVDIGPTVCQSLGIETESGFSGTSLARLIDDESLRDRKIFARAFIDFDTYDLFGVLWHNYKYTYDRVRKTDSLYATDTDVLERIPLQSAPRPVLRELRMALQAQIDRSKALPKMRHVREISPEILTQLKGIGYMQ